MLRIWFLFRESTLFSSFIPLSLCARCIYFVALRKEREKEGCFASGFYLESPHSFPLYPPSLCARCIYFVARRKERERGLLRIWFLFRESTLFSSLSLFHSVRGVFILSPGEKKREKEGCFASGFYLESPHSFPLYPLSLCEVYLFCRPRKEREKEGCFASGFYLESPHSFPLYPPSLCARCIYFVALRKEREKEVASHLLSLNRLS